MIWYKRFTGMCCRCSSTKASLTCFSPQCTLWPVLERASPPIAHRSLFTARRHRVGDKARRLNSRGRADLAGFGGSASRSRSQNRKRLIYAPARLLTRRALLWRVTSEFVLRHDVSTLWKKHQANGVEQVRVRSKDLWLNRANLF